MNYGDGQQFFQFNFDIYWSNIKYLLLSMTIDKIHLYIDLSLQKWMVFFAGPLTAKKLSLSSSQHKNTYSYNENNCCQDQIKSPAYIIETDLSKGCDYDYFRWYFNFPYFAFSVPLVSFLNLKSIVLTTLMWISGTLMSIAVTFSESILHHIQKIIITRMCLITRLLQHM